MKTPLNTVVSPTHLRWLITCHVPPEGEFTKLHAQMRHTAIEKGMPVETEGQRNTSNKCHACGEVGYRPRQATFNCANDDCWMSESQAEVNGAINIGDRHRNGESRFR